MGSKILGFIGYIIIVILIIAATPLALPKLLGMQAYNVISGSMEPTLSVGSIVYVKPVNFIELQEGDVIAFNAGASVVTHRITNIDADDMLITTKGDANEGEDFTPVAYTNVIGKVVAYFPFIGNVAAMFSDTAGKIGAGLLLIIGVILSNAGEKKRKPAEDEEKSTKKTATGRINPKMILALGLVIVMGSLGGFMYIFMGYSKSNTLYASLNEEYVELVVEEESGWEDTVDVDIAALQQINPDVAGWLYIEGTDVSYPIMYSGDDEAYLRTTIDHEHATAGSIFLEGYNLPDFSDSHNIIYGHNMRNLSMFGTLKYYKSDENYINEHKYFQIITEDAKMRYEIFSYFDTEAASWVYAVPYSDSEEFGDYISELLKKSYMGQETDIPNVTSSDKVVTLSTCSTTGMRFTVHGVLVETLSTN